ncbi:hypothetical protein K5D57_04965 [Pseudomonas cichorii]|nr:hypothetical protein [Pseudomonas cichorii]
MTRLKESDMTNTTPSEETKTIERALARYMRKASQARGGRSVLANLAAPEHPSWWGGDPDFADLVPREDQEKDMPITIALWPNYASVAGDVDTLYFEWKLATSSTWAEVQTIQFPGPINAADFPKQLDFKSSNFALEGTFELRYRVVIENGTDTPSDVTTFIIDKTPPHNNQSPAKLMFVDQATIDQDGITQDYITANSGVPVVIPPYADEKPGDSVQFYIYSATQPIDPVHEGTLNANREVIIPGDAFSLPDGMIYLDYRLLDKAGNRGPFSDRTQTGLFIGPLPVEPLDAPLVPLADDGVLDLVDISSTPELVQITLYGNWLNSDHVILTWGTAALKVDHTVGPTPVDPIILGVPYSTVVQPAYGDATKGPKATDISYVVQRGNRNFPSPATTINVDLFVPGPVNPDRPDPINRSLPRVTVKGTGPNATDNVLNADDASLPVEVSVALYDPIGAGERMKLYWKSTDKSVGLYLPDPAADTPGDIYTFTVAWDDIKDKPAEVDLPVFYTVGLADGSGNKEMCEPTLVDVTAALPIKLASPVFPDARTSGSGQPILNCTSFIDADHHVRVEVPGNNPLLQGGEELTFTWQAYKTREGLSGDEAGTEWTLTKTITDVEASSGFTFNVEPYMDHIEPVGRDGSIRLKYVSKTTPPMVGDVYIRASSTNAGGTCFV